MLQANTNKTNTFQVWSFKGTYLLCTEKQAVQGQYWKKGSLVFSGSPAEIQTSPTFGFLTSDFSGYIEYQKSIS